MSLGEVKGKWWKSCYGGGEDSNRLARSARNLLNQLVRTGGVEPPRAFTRQIPSPMTAVAGSRNLLQLVDLKASRISRSCLQLQPGGDNLGTVFRAPTRRIRHFVGLFSKHGDRGRGNVLRNTWRDRETLRPRINQMRRPQPKQSPRSRVIWR